MLLLALPFIDLRAERRLLRRPVAIVAAILVVVSMGVLTYKGATAKESLGSELVAKVPKWATKQGFAGQPAGDRRREALRRSPAASTATRTSAPAAATSARRT